MKIQFTDWAHCRRQLRLHIEKTNRDPECPLSLRWPSDFALAAKVGSPPFM